MNILDYENYEVTQKYNGDVKGGHTGIDIIGRGLGTTRVKAYADGKVVLVVTGKCNDRSSTGANSYGNYIQIDHGNGFSTLYAHLSKVNVKAGDNIKKGDFIGEMGNTGNSTGLHLHFEVRKNNYVIDPTNYIKKETHTDKSKELKERILEVLKDY